IGMVSMANSDFSSRVTLALLGAETGDFQGPLTFDRIRTLSEYEYAALYRRIAVLAEDPGRFRAAAQAAYEKEFQDPLQTYDFSMEGDRVVFGLPPVSGTPLVVEAPPVNFPASWGPSITRWLQGLGFAGRVEIRVGNV